MSDYLPKHTGPTWTHDITVDVIGGRLVTAAGAPAGDSAVDVVGVAAHDAKAGDACTVYDLNVGVHRLVASGVIGKGAQVVADAGGKVKALAAVTTPTAGDVTGTRAIVGKALTASTDDGDIILVKG